MSAPGCDQSGSAMKLLLCLVDRSVAQSSLPCSQPIVTSPQRVAFFGLCRTDTHVGSQSLHQARDSQCREEPERCQSLGTRKSAGVISGETKARKLEEGKTIKRGVERTRTAISFP